MLLHGPSGCGKSLIVRHAAAAAGAQLHTVTAATIAAAYIGMLVDTSAFFSMCNNTIRPFGCSTRHTHSYISHTHTPAHTGESEQRLRDVFAQAKQAATEGNPAVVFLDDLDSLAPARTATGTGLEARLVGQLLTCIDQVALECAPPAHVVVVGATTAPRAVDPALRRPGRLDREILVGVPNRSDRQTMLETALKQLPRHRIGDDLQVAAGAVAARTAGYTGADLMALVREAALANDGRVDVCALDAAMAVVRPSLARGAAVEVASGAHHFCALLALRMRRLPHHHSVLG